MSNPGERDDAPEIEEIEPDEIEEVDAAEEGDEETPDEGDGQEDGQGGDEAAGRQADVDAPSQPKKGNPEFGRLRQRAREAEEVAENTRRELNELRAAAQGRQTREQQELEAQRVALMAPEEKYDYLLKQQETRFEGRFAALQFQQADSGDRVAFQSLCARPNDQGKALASVADEVEKRLGELRRNGGNTSREVLAKYIIGERAFERAGRVKAKQAKTGAANIARNRVAAPSSRGDVAGGSRRSGNEVEQRRARLEDQQI